MTIGLAAASFLLALYLLYKVRMLAGALALLPTQVHATDDVPEVLKYGMSNNGLIKEEIQAGNATFVYEPVKFHLDVATMAITGFPSLSEGVDKELDSSGSTELRLGEGVTGAPGWWPTWNVWPRKNAS